ncbi:hypothetical protein SAMN05216249_1032 [Acetitomaculum ruminis DSM 5522]|uniref:Ribbon-helix-helix protein, copG family n=1 Tax=Acetitomaculum ruminis DSM 5522 TaxID=1120918 RepID=A0A1I0W2A9_9FIRM|nr:hypothetical protein [Acetitomaculum ruminis]SFA82066.1 hypothetical protein SAMN05216249_1032 [Acetitomaculum ruminis DSM 5522]
MENMKKVRIGCNISKQTIERLNEYVKVTGLTKRKVLENALFELIYNNSTKGEIDKDMNIVSVRFDGENKSEPQIENKYHEFKFDNIESETSKFTRLDSSITKEISDSLEKYIK